MNIGSLLWSTGIDNTGLRQGAQQAGESFQQMGKSLKDSITNQKQLIKELTLDIKNLNEAAKSGTYYQKIGAMDNLTAAKKTLAEEQSRLLGMQQQQIDGNAAESASQGGIVASLGKWLLGIATVTAAMKIFKDVMASTERSADTFHSYIKAATEGLNMFYKMIATGDFSNFTENMEKAILAGKEYVYQMSFVANLNNERVLKEIELNKIIEDNRRILNANDKISTADKIAAGDKMLEAMKKKGEGEIVVAVSTFRAVSDISTSKSKLTEDEINLGLRNYKVIKEVGEKYAELKKISDDYEKSIKPKTVNGIVIPQPGADNIIKERGAYIGEVRAQMVALNKETAKLNIIPEQAAKIYSGLEDLSDEEKKALTTATAEIGRAQLQFQIESKRVYTFTENLRDKDATAATAAAKKKFEALQLDNKIKDTEEAMTKAAESGNKTEVYLLSKKLVLLEAEKKLRDDIIKLMIFEAKYSSKYTEAVLDIPMVSKTGQLVTTKKPTKGTPQDLIDTSKESIKRNEKQIKDLTDEENDRLKEQAQLRDDILNAAGDLTGQLVEQGVLSQEQGRAIGDTLNGFKDLASGNFVGAAMSAVTSIISMFPNQAEEFQARIDKINAALDYQRRLIELSDRRGGQEVGRLKEIQLLKEKQKADEEQLIRAEDKRSGKIFKIGPVYKGYVKDVRELTAAVLEDKQAVEDATIALADFYTGGTTESTISGAIRSGFEDGKQSALDFASTFEDFMRTAINASLEELSKPEIALWYKEFAADMASGGGLDEKEKNDLKIKWDKIAKDNADRRDEAYKIAGMGPLAPDVNNNNTATGQIKAAITEDTGTRLMGLWTRGINESITQTSILSQSNGLLSQIADNTLRTAYNTLRTADNTESLKIVNTTNGRDKG